MIRFISKGDLSRTNKFLTAMDKREMFKVLDRYGQLGVDALASASPVDSGRTASSWGYVARYDQGSPSIIWTNGNTINGFPVAIMLQYGHGTGTGGYVRGRDYINPALRPIFDKIVDDVWKEVVNA